MLVENLAGASFGDVIALYVGALFGADNAFLVAGLAVFYVALILGPAVLLPILKRFGYGDPTVIKVGIALVLASFVLMAFPISKLSFFIGVFLFAGNGIITPAVIGAISRLVFPGVFVINSLSFILSSLLFLLVCLFVCWFVYEFVCCCLLA